MNPPVTTWTTRRKNDSEHSDWVEGSHSEDRMPQYNFSNIASAQEADQATAVNDQLLFDVALDVEYIGGYPQTINLDNEEMEGTFVVLGSAPGLESFESAMAGQTSRLTLDNIGDQAGTDMVLLPSKLTAAHLVAQNAPLQREPITRWVLETPGFPAQAAADYAPEPSLVSTYTETHVSYDNYEWVDISSGTVDLDRDTQGFGSISTTLSDSATYGDELERN